MTFNADGSSVEGSRQVRGAGGGLKVAVAGRSTETETTMADAVDHLASARSVIDALALSSSKTLRTTMALELARHCVSVALICLDECRDSMVSGGNAPVNPSALTG
jgi:hypothetical protein